MVSKVQLLSAQPLRPLPGIFLAQFWPCTKRYLFEGISNQPAGWLNGFFLPTIGCGHIAKP
jgi:hypothetical protein